MASLTGEIEGTRPALWTAQPGSPRGCYGSKSLLERKAPLYAHARIVLDIFVYYVYITHGSSVIRLSGMAGGYS